MLVEMLNIKEIIKTPTRQLSLGQRMRCEIAAAFLHEPKIVFLDEPTIGLDSISKIAVRDFVKKINKEKNTTIILTTHDTGDIEALTKRVILIGKGKLLLDGSFNNLKPAAKKDTMGGWNLVPEYNRLWDEFNFEFELIQNKTDFNTLLALLKKYASTMPSAAYKSKSDISLYDHSKTTAALAVSRYLFNRDGDVKLTQKDDLNCYLAIEGDISGIQKFIFKISSPQEAQSGMSKRLRGRSLYLTLLCDAIATHIAEELELCEANILFCGGGRFTPLQTV